MSDAGTIAIKNKLLDVKTLNAEAIESLGLKSYPEDNQYLTIGNFFYKHTIHGQSSHDYTLPEDNLDPAALQVAVHAQRLAEHAQHAFWKTF